MVDVSDVSVAYDRIFNFVVFRHHLIHFYLPCPELRHEGEIFGPHGNGLQQDPPMLQQAIEGQRHLDREVDSLVTAFPKISEPPFDRCLREPGVSSTVSTPCLYSTPKFLSRCNMCHRLCRF